MTDFAAFYQRKHIQWLMKINDFLKSLPYNNLERKITCRLNTK